METPSDPETGNTFTGVNQGNGGGVQRAGKALNCPAPSRGKPSKSLRYLRFLLFHSRSHTVLALAAMLAAAVALLPAAACAQLGLPVWTNYYNGPGTGDDYAWAMSVDASGNVVVTGQSYIGLGGGDRASRYATIKYSSAGVPLWTNLYGPEGYDSSAWVVAVDASGNVFVTGSSYGGDPLFWYAAIKYSSAGTPLWTNTLTDTGWIKPAVVVDTNNDAFVTAGRQMVKLSSAGSTLWTRQHGLEGDVEGNLPLALDRSGNAIVAGGTGTSPPDYVTIKYSSAGVKLWTRTYAGPTNFDERATAVGVDPSDNVYVTGYCWDGGQFDYATIKYSSAGVPLWTNWQDKASCDALVVDASSNVYVAGSGPMIKYSSAGVPLWINQWLVVAKMALDASDNLYAIRDNRTTALSRDGLPLWTNLCSASLKAIAVDPNANVYVTGSATGPDGTPDFVTIKYVTRPFIIRQPLGRTNAVGTTASFTVETAGSAPFTYQWRRQGTNLVNGVTVSGVTTTNLLIANAQFADAAGYTVVVTNVYGSATSHVAQLTVINPGRFANLSYLPATGFSFIFRDATVGQPYRIQRSPSMAEGSWTNWQSFTYTEPTGFMDVGATSAERRFYRVVSP